MSRFGISAPLLAQIAFSSSAASAFLMSSTIFACTSAGVPLGAHRPYQVVTV